MIALENDLKTNAQGVEKPLTGAPHLQIVKEADQLQPTLDPLHEINHPEKLLPTPQEQLAYRIQVSKYRMINAIRTQAIEASRLGLPEAEALKAQAKSEIQRYNAVYHPELIDLERSE